MNWEMPRLLLIKLFVMFGIIVTLCFNMTPSGLVNVANLFFNWCFCAMLTNFFINLVVLDFGTFPFIKFSCDLNDLLITSFFIVSLEDLQLCLFLHDCFV